MSSWGLQVEVFQPQTFYLASPAIIHLLSPAFPATFILASFPAECGQWLVILHSGLLSSLTPWNWPQDSGFKGHQPVLFNPGLWSLQLSLILSILSGNVPQLLPPGSQPHNLISPKGVTIPTAPC